jgi:hypothetical protein
MMFVSPRSGFVQQDVRACSDLWPLPDARTARLSLRTLREPEINDEKPWAIYTYCFSFLRRLEAE